MPIKGLEKGDGVPSSPCGLRRDKLGKRERTDPAKGFSLFPKAPISTFIGNKAKKRAASAEKGKLQTPLQERG